MSILDARTRVSFKHAHINSLLVKETPADIHGLFEVIEDDDKGFVHLTDTAGDLVCVAVDSIAAFAGIRR
jgi:hypothetical protein